MLTTGCSFLLTPGSGEKLLVSGIALLGTILYLIYFASTLPFHQSSVPIIGEINLFSIIRSIEEKMFTVMHSFCFILQ